MPDTLSVSCVIAVSSESDSCVSPAMRARTWPTRRCTITRNGIMTTAMIVRRQSMMIIATRDAMTVTTLPRMLVNVLVSTPETAPTSFCSRDWITPVFVRVKKPSSIACKWSKSWTRRSPVIRLPIVEVNHVCRTPRAADSTNRPIMMSTSRHRSAWSGPAPPGGKSASSKICCTIRAGTTAIAAPAITSTAVTIRRPV